MWIWIVLGVLMVFWGSIAIAACRVAGRIARMEQEQQEIDARVRELLADVEIDLKPATS
jgi:hypothetical protein